MLRKSFVLVVMGTVIFFLCSVSSADVPDSVNYQGKLTTAAGGCLNDTVQMTFTIYADESGTVSEWSETQTQVVVKEGIFSVVLGSVNSLPHSLFDGSVKYLGVQVESDPEMTPLKPIVSVAYAFRSAIADSALNVPAAGIASVDGVSNPGGDVDFIQNNSITITPNDGANTVTFGETHSARTDNPHQVSAAQTGGLVSVDGVSNAGGDVDFIAGTNMTITPNDGANTITFSSTATGIGGSGTTNYIPKFTAPTTIGNSVIYQSGTDIGIGLTTPSQKLGVAGNIALEGSGASQSSALDFRDTGGSEWQVQYLGGGLNFWEAGIGSRMLIEDGGQVGIGTTSPGYKLHVNGNFFANTVNTGQGNNDLYPMNQPVRSTDTPTFLTINTGLGNHELYAMNQHVRTTDNVSFNRAYLNDYGYALGGFHVGGSSDPGTDNLYVDGKVGIGTTSPHADAKLHVAWNDYYAGYFTSNRTSSSTHVIHSEYTGGQSDAAAVYGKSRPTDFYGIGGEFEGGFYGVIGSVFPTGSYSYYGVRGYVSGGTGGSKYGVYGYATGTGTNYGVYYSNGLGGSGSKSCIVKTSQGPTALYCQESPENWFEDFGEGTLVNGQTHIELDALFLETVTINAANPMKVFVQLEGDCNGVYVSKGITGFDVVELKNGTSNVPFSYRVVAKRKGFEDKRLDYTAAGENDPYLYPEAAERMEKERLENAGE